MRCLARLSLCPLREYRKDSKYYQTTQPLSASPSSPLRLTPYCPQNSTDSTPRVFAAPSPSPRQWSSNPLRSN